MIDVKVKLLSQTAKMPVYKTSGAACADLFSDEDIIISGHTSVAVKTNVAFELPEDYEAQIRPRSGLSLDLPLLIIFGTVDEDFRGGLKVIMKNLGDQDIRILRGDRIAQVKFEKVERARFILSEQLSETNRGDGGFGHTGR